jgi:peptidoglycan/LPS O-acetylase OafA/YrhL
LSDPLRYRADIDGLRAIAVVVVILFHLGFERFSGGYVGVDVFFVISGFLITRMIRAQLGAESFSFSGFYVRRARRLFPALLVTVVASFVAACVLLAPQHLERVGGSTVSALFAVSNFYFWQESGYFDAEATLKPLLHTWSLGVEEQFYLLWPALLVALLRCSSRAVLGFLGLASVASLALGEYWLVSDPAAAFYLLPARVVELALGAAMVWLVDHTPRQRLLLEPLVWIGLSLILYATFDYDETTDFPGLSSLVPCIGAALLVYAGEARYSGWILRSRLAVGIGLISYPLYLIHWPLLVFTRYAKAEALDDFDRLAVAGFSLLGAAAIYRFVENPIRHAIRRERHLSAGVFGLACLGLAAFAALPAALAWLQGGVGLATSDGDPGCRSRYRPEALPQPTVRRG